MKTSIAIIDYGMGNLHSVASALSHVAPDAEVSITADADVIRNADRVLFPGVGAIRDCMAEIRRLHFDSLVPEAIASGKPVLAICVGMQALMHHSEENNGVNCLDIFSGAVKFFGNELKDDAGVKLKVPHMGWNEVEQTVDHPLWQGIENNSRFYFVHSYFVEAENNAHVAGISKYPQPFAAALYENNVFATQFHPEKSDKLGLKLLENFMNWNGSV